MIMHVFAVFDKQIGAFLPPFHCRSKGEAIRSFTEAVNDPGKTFGKYAIDYSLVSLGQWDDNTGLFTGGDAVRVIGASEVVTVGDDIFTPEKEDRRLRSM